MFCLAVTTNKNNEEAVRMALENIIPHTFGEHENCGSFCKTDADGVHVYKYLKDGKCLKDLNSRIKLEQIIRPYIESARQIAPCGSSQVNESINNTICSKHPKSAFYSGSESHLYRVCAAVCQRNIGYSYVKDLNIILNLSPGKNTMRFKEEKDKQFLIKLSAKKTITNKKRRLLKQRLSKYNTKTANNNDYQSGMGFLNTTYLMDEVLFPGKFIFLIL